MKRIDKIREYFTVQAENGSFTFTAQEIAQALSIQRCDASADLNRLYKAGFLEKAGKRPVGYRLAQAPSVPEDPGAVLQDGMDGQVSIPPQSANTIDYISDASPSLKKACQLAKTAISYPPHGLNTLITGATGVGKTFLAEAMWDYACKNDTFGTGGNIPFISFNCAEYADNPQLLLSRLFGHKKGAFTGADKDSEGLVKEADGGILFLDEVHRLPPTGQEMLFSITDHSVYRQLGENRQHPISVMLICATTEDPSNVLLNTYLRRFPVHIHIPTLAERTPKERLYLITNFIKEEARKLNTPIWISGSCLKTLVSYDAQAGNIGEIKNIINLCCAKSYLQYLTETPPVPIALPESIADKHSLILSILPNELPSALFEEPRYTRLPENFETLHIFKDGLLIYPYQLANTLPETLDKKYTFDIYNYIQRKIDTYRTLNLSDPEINGKIFSDLDTYFSNTIQYFDHSEDENTKLIYGIISPEYFEIAESILKQAQEVFDRDYSQGLYVAFALHLQEFHERINDGKVINNPSLNELNLNFAEEMRFLHRIRPAVEQKLKVSIPEEELGFWAKFLSKLENKNEDTRNIGLLVVCHGDQIASGYASLINNMLSVNCVFAADMPLDMTFEESFSRICDTIRQHRFERGVLIMADMGSLTGIEKRLIEKTGIYCRVLPVVCAPLLLEAAKSIILESTTLDVLCKDLFEAYLTDITKKYKQLNSGLNSEKETILDSDVSKFIITICASGYGSAMAIKNLLEEKLSSVENLKIVAISLDDDVMSYVHLMKDRLKLIIGGVNPAVPGVPFISIEQVLTAAGIRKIKGILEKPAEDFNASEKETFLAESILPLIIQSFPKFAPDADPALLEEACMIFYDGIREIIGTERPNNAFVNLILHFVCMVERMQKGEKWVMPAFGADIIQSKHDLYLQLKTLINSACRKFGFRISDAELYYFLINI